MKRPHAADITAGVWYTDGQRYRLVSEVRGKYAGYYPAFRNGRGQLTLDPLLITTTKRAIARWAYGGEVKDPVVLSRLEALRERETA